MLSPMLHHTVYQDTRIQRDFHRSSLEKREGWKHVVEQEMLKHSGGHFVTQKNWYWRPHDCTPPGLLYTITGQPLSVHISFMARCFSFPKTRTNDQAQSRKIDRISLIEVSIRHGFDQSAWAIVWKLQDLLVFAPQCLSGFIFLPEICCLSFLSLVDILRMHER